LDRPERRHIARAFAENVLLIPPLMTAQG
jgi:hypothetical protein